MPVQTIRIYPGSTYDLLFGGEATVAWEASAPPTFDVVDDPKGAPDGLAGRFSGSSSTPRTAYAEYGLASPPSGVSVSAVRMGARVLATGTEDVYDLVVTGYIRPSGAGQGSSGAHFHGTPVTITSEQGGAEVYHDIDLGEWTTDPNTSLAFTLSTLQVMKIGARFECPATAPAVNAGIKLDALFIDVDVVTVAGDIDGIRTVGSWLLRLFRREPELVEITGPALLGDVNLLESFGLEHPLGPAPPGLTGWQAALWRRGLPIVLSKTYDLLESTVRLRCLNPRLFLTRWWSTFLTDLGHSLDGQGIPLLHSGGGGISVNRDQVGFVERSGNPPDGLIMEAPEDRPKYDRRGLLVEGGGAVNKVLNSTFSQGSGNSFDSWTPNQSGTGTVTESLIDYLFDEPGLRRSVRLAVGGTDASPANIACDPVSLTSGLFRVRVRTKNMFGSAKLAATIVRASDSFYLDAGTGTWGASPFYNRVGQDASGGGWRDWHSGAQDTGGTDNITVTVGYFAEAGTQGFIAIGASVEVYEDAKFIGSDLPTTDSPVTRLDDEVRIENNGTGRAWDSTFGSFNLTVNPLWSLADLDVEEEKVFWAVKSAGDGDPTYEEVLFRRDASGGHVIFRRNKAYEARKAFSPVAGVPFKISGRWVATGGELRMPANSHQVAVNNMWGKIATSPGVSLPPESWILVGSNGQDWADAFLSHPDVSPLVLHDEELARRP